MEHNSYLIFLSHKAEIQKEVKTLKDGLELYGVEAFVAHSDIYPGTEWQEEILKALEDMDAFVPILTEDFHDSPWTDQEVGYAIAAEVPIIPLRCGLDPYGFMGKYQGLSCDWNSAPREIIRALIGDPSLVDSFVGAVSECDDFASANRLSEILPYIETLTEAQISRLLSAFRDNDQISKSYGFNGTYSSKYGRGLANHLSEITGREFLLKKDWESHYYIEPPPFWSYGMLQ